MSFGILVNNQAGRITCLACGNTYEVARRISIRREDKLAGRLCEYCAQLTPRQLSINLAERLAELREKAGRLLDLAARLDRAAREFSSPPECLENARRSYSSRHEAHRLLDTASAVAEALTISRDLGNGKFPRTFA